MQVNPDPDLDKKIKELDDARSAADDFIRTIKNKNAPNKERETAARKLAAAVKIPYRDPQNPMAYIRWITRTLIPKGNQLKKDLDLKKTALSRSAARDAERVANRLQQRQPFISGTAYRLIGAKPEDGGNLKGGVAVVAFRIAEQTSK